MTSPIVSLLSARPNQCQIFCGLPLELDEFESDAEAGPDGCWAKSVMEGQMGRSGPWSRSRVVSTWERITRRNHGALALLRETIDEATASGSKVEKATTIESFLNATKADVVTIVAHSHGGQVELRDGMHAPERIACGFPIEYSGTIDLSTCSSFRLHDAIRERCASLPRIITNRRPVSLGIRIAVYRLTIRLLREHPRPFIDAYAEAWSRLRRSSSQ